MTLTELLNTHHDWPGGLDNDQALAWLRETLTVQDDVAWTDYMLWLSETSGVPKLRIAASGADEAVANAAELALIIAQAGMPLSASRADVRSALSPLITGGVFTSAEADALLAKGQKTPSRLKDNGIKEYDDESLLHWIEEAR